MLTFIDISSQHFLGMARKFADNIVNAVREPLLILNGDLEDNLWPTRLFIRISSNTRPKRRTADIHELGNGQWDIPKLRELLEEIIPKNASFTDFQVEHDFPMIGHKIMLLNARRIPAAGEHPEHDPAGHRGRDGEPEKEREDQEIIARLQKELEEARQG